LAALDSSLLPIVAALAAGLIVGLERGWRERDAADGQRVAGLRTFALTGLLGGVLALVGPWLLAAGALGLAALIGIGYGQSVRLSGRLSATSAVAQLLTFGLGALAATGMPLLAVGAAVIVATLLNLKSTLHRWLRLIEHEELTAALQMLVLSAVILPLLPDQAFGPYAALNPYRLWWAVVLIAGLSLSGHVAMRLAGAQRGTLLTGLLGGLASSTAATLALARQLRGQDELVEPTAAGGLAACAVMFLRMVLILMFVSPALGRLLLAPMLGAALTLMACAAIHWRRRPRGAQPGGMADLPAFDLGTALGFGVFLGLMSMLTEASKQWLGAGGLYGLALLSGLVDVDAMTISAARTDAATTVPAGVAAIAICLAALSNMVLKAVMAWTTGGPPLGRALAWGYGSAVAVGGVLLGLVMRWA
jgi:uncharacterized membrane protein (DUF4010 family)